MDAAQLIRDARTDSGFTLRQLATLAGTSHSTLAAYESSSKSPNVRTLDRILRAAGFAPDVQVHRRHRSGPNGADSEKSDPLTKGEELAAVLELAEAFPARHADRMEAPVFTRIK